MWQEAKANDKRIKELMVDHRKRAERRRAYYESRLGDPQQLIRVIGISSKVYPDAEQFYYHENTDNLMPWQGNPDIKIDRFDGRSLLDFVPEASNSRRGYQEISKEEKEMADELNFERYHDLIEAERLNVTEAERLAEVDEEWTKLLDRHQAKLALLNNQEKGKDSKNRGFGFDYGTNKVNEEDVEDDDTEKESQLLKEVDILQYVDELTDKDKQVLNEMSGKYGIRSYARLLRVAKKDRDDELRALKRQQGEGKPKDLNRGSRRANERRRLRRRNNRDDKRNDDKDRYRRRYSPTYEPYRRSSDSEESSGEEDEPSRNDSSDFVIEFGSSTPEESTPSNDKEEEDRISQSQRSSAPIAPVEKKLTPMEKLKLKMRAGLEKQIVSDEKDRRQKEREKELENLRELARNQGLPINAYMRPEPPTRESVKEENNSVNKGGRYRSPPSPTSSSPKRASRSPSPIKSRYRSRSRSPSRKRSRSPSHRLRPLSRDRHRSSYKSSSSSRHSSSRDHHRRLDRSRSPSNKKRYRSPSPSNKRRYRSPSPDKKRRYRSPSPDRRYSKRSRSRSSSRRRERSHRR